MNNQVKQSKNKYHQNLINENVGNPEKFWKNIKTVYPLNNKDSEVCRLFNVDGVATTDNKLIADSFCNFFSTVANKLKTSAIPFTNFIWCSQNKLTDRMTPTTSNFSFNYTSVIIIHEYLRQLKVKKAAGLDNIPPRMIRDGASVLSKPLAHIINLSLKCGTVPSEWKIAKINPLFKSGKTSDLNNYRPISILPIFSKIMEKVVHHQLIEYLEHHKLLYNKQFGYRKGKSTELAVTLFVDEIRGEIDRGNLVGAVFDDLSKAFDTISHAGIIQKLSFYGVQHKELNWFKDYLFNRHQVVMFNNFQSKSYPVTCGVPQGSILGPLLFLVYFNDFIKVVKHSKVIKYADDTVLYIGSSKVDDIQSKLEEDLNQIAHWFHLNELVINTKVGKTESMLFGTNQRLKKIEKTSFKISVNDTIINFCETYKYLGVKLDNSLRLNQFMDEIYRKASGRLKLLNRVRKSLTVHSANIAFHSLIVPLLCYCGILCLGAATNSNIQRFERLKIRAANIISGKTSTNLKIPNIINLWKKRACTIVSKVIQKDIDETFFNYFQPLENNTRNKGILMRLPKVKLENGRKSFRFMGTKIFNELPIEIRHHVEEKTFSNILNKHF